LHHVPFLRFRAHVSLDKVFGPGALSFAEAVQRANEALAPRWLVVDTATMTITAGGCEAPIPEATQFAIYRFLSEIRREGLSIDGGEPGALHYEDLLSETDARGKRLLDRLGEIIEDVWYRGKSADYIRAGDQREAFVSLTPRPRKDKAAEEPSDPKEL